MATTYKVDGKVSYGSNGRTAQVTTLVNGRSVTRHLRRQGGAWWGNNPDPAAIPTNRDADLRVGYVQVRISELTEELDGLEALKPRDIVKGGISLPVSVAKRRIAEELRPLERELTAALAHQEAVRNELPLIAEFILPR